MPGRKFFWSPDGCDHWEIPVKYVSGYWKLTLRNGDGLVVAERVHRSEVRRMFQQELVPWQWRQT